MPESRPISEIGARVHELRIKDLRKKVEWRIVYRTDPDAVLILGVFEKKTRNTPRPVIDACQRRLTDYDAI
jgi:phage-related protein